MGWRGYFSVSLAIVLLLGAGIVYLFATRVQFIDGLLSENPAWHGWVDRDLQLETDCGYTDWRLTGTLIRSGDGWTMHGQWRAEARSRQGGSLAPSVLVCEYRLGKKRGTLRTEANGVTIYSCEYEEDLKDGLETYWFTTGDAAKTITWEKGKRISMESFDSP